MGHVRIWVKCLLISTCLPIAAAAVAQRIQLAAFPVYNGLHPGLRPAPVEVLIDNKGPNVRGMLHAQSDSFDVEYPVELPAGSKKRIVTYPTVGYGGSNEIRFTLSAPGSRTSIVMRSAAEPYLVGPQVCMVSDVDGELALLRRPSKNGSVINPVYLKPDSAPDRPVGYVQLSALVLGQGSERLADAAVQAIQSWALTGGTIIVVGGASSPVLTDRRWSGALPVVNATTRTVEGSTKLQSRYGGPTGKFTSLVGEPSAGASKRSDGLIYEKPFGLGRVVYLAFNPFEPPMSRWTGRYELMKEILDPSLLNNAAFARTIIEQNPNVPSPAWSSPSGHVHNYDQVNNPFKTALPATDNVLLILFAYFVAVVPVNFLVLRKFKRGELAWLTAPVIALSFAGVFFFAARGLYSSSLSTSTNGFLVMQEGHPESQVIGKAQMFFPQGGSHDLRFDNVDLVAAIDQGQYGYGNASYSTMHDLNAIDNGSIEAPSFQTPNLAFREITYRQRVDTADWIRIEQSGDKITVQNNSPYKLTRADLLGATAMIKFQDIEAGKQVSSKVSDWSERKGMASGPVDASLIAMLTRHHCWVLVARIEGMRAGPQIGNEVKGSEGITLICTSDDKVEAR